ncbi:ATP-grasp fold, subdomain 1,Pre-ATP-grasp domain,Synapsin, ATP-binding domain,Synapsin,Synapsin, pre- [Cinara cedri]|uniref:ATP-grasp fold, subdomain 1,Pre-ATP-grasp domain,Synapsin, ATP-binding domain,Synapsin,Synapsin, pre n=1 Tax=Cinara cedri TaxID=506608 RepID=A0A5E4N3N7_9HEMI|nr:ATP-grasp fold, subdomain 1,Pre-ATP-grasp domain,Synapsin, ATP-binding domain,Synapsin,Synapsin, pre- [Cinara cedri]
MAPVADHSTGPVPGTSAPGSQTQQRAQQRQYASKTSRSQAATPASEAADMRLEFQQQAGSRTISAPTSPAKTRDSILQRVQSLTDAAKEKANSLSNDIKYAAATRRQQRVNKDRMLTLLVVDDENYDWSRYFRGKRFFGDFEVHVEQADIKDLTVTASAEKGCTVSMAVLSPSGSRVVRSFRPDFFLCRQSVRDADRDYRNVLLGLNIGGVPSINSLNSLYNFQDKPWVYGQLVQLQKKLGKENFPLIEQTFYPSSGEMSVATQLPVVLKVGHAHGGVGKIKIENNADFQDMTSVVSVASTYCTTEPFVDSKYDLHLTKIGTHYRALMRKSISGNWKSCVGSAMLEETEVLERYKFWLDSVAELFGGLDILALEVVVSKDGIENIIGVNDSALSLLGNQQDEDRKHIFDLVMERLEVQVLANMGPQTMAPTLQEEEPPAIPARRDSLVSESSVTSSHQSSSQPPKTNLSRQGSIVSAPVPASQNKVPALDDSEDTMKNLRKTFAGIFGEM